MCPDETQLFWTAPRRLSFVLSYPASLKFMVRWLSESQARKRDVSGRQSPPRIWQRAPCRSKHNRTRRALVPGSKWLPWKWQLFPEEWEWSSGDSGSLGWLKDKGHTRGDIPGNKDAFSVACPYPLITSIIALSYTPESLLGHLPETRNFLSSWTVPLVFVLLVIISHDSVKQVMHI